MAKTLSEAIANYGDSVNRGAAQRYADGIQGAPQEYARGMSEFLGAPVSGSRVDKYSRGLAGAPDKYARGVQGKADKYGRNLRRAMTGA